MSDNLFKFPIHTNTDVNKSYAIFFSKNAKKIRKK